VIRHLFHSALCVLLLGSLYLYLCAGSAMSSTVGVLVLLHIALGVVLIVPLFFFMPTRPRASAWEWRGVRFLLLVCGLTGAWLAAVAAAGNSTAHFRWMLTLHVLCGFAAAALLIISLLTHYASRFTFHVSRFTHRTSQFGSFVAAGVVVLLATYAYAPRSYYRTLTATNAAQAGNRFFPAGLSVIRNRQSSIRSSAYCGAKGCHADVYAQWLSSSHRRAAASRAYQKSAAYFASRKGNDAVRWCDGCHAPMRFTPSRHTQQEGVNCLTCHATTRVKELTGNGRYELTLPDNYPFADARNGIGYWLHGFLIRVRPAPHQQAFLKRGLHDTSEFCSSCHRLSYNVPQNHYKFLRGLDEYGDWQDSFVSGNSVHGFFPPAKPTQCQGCHDAHGSMSQSVNRSMGKSSVTVDVFALRRMKPHSREEELIAPLHGASVRPGESVVVDVVIHNCGVGHDFPAGMTDIKDVWLEFNVTDADGRTLFQGGRRDEDGFVNEEAHIYRLVVLDRAGQRIDKNNLFDMVTPLYHRMIPAGQSDVVRYRLTVPKDVKGRLTMMARLYHCKYNTRFADWVFAGRREKGQHPPPVGALVDETRWTFDPARRVPLLPVKVVAEDQAAIKVLGSGFWVLGQRPTQNPEPKTPNLSFYNYGVGLLTQGDLPRAARAFRRAVELSPKDVQPRIGLGRVYLVEGDLLAARAQFLDALRIAPGSPQAQAFLGTMLRKMGQYDKALKVLQPVAERFPRDKLLHFDIGMCFFLSGRYEEASRAFVRMLDIDPDDLSAHYNLMLCYQRLRRASDARREEAIYRYLKEDETVKQITGPYLLKHPIDDREVQTIHEHVLKRLCEQ
jgi:Flp pilus assembly protein TadD